MRINADKYYEDVIRHEIANKIRLQAFEKLQEQLGDQMTSSWFDFDESDEIQARIKDFEKVYKPLVKMVQDGQKTMETKAPRKSIIDEKGIKEFEKWGLELQLFIHQKEMLRERIGILVRFQKKIWLK